MALQEMQRNLRGGSWWRRELRPVINNCQVKQEVVGVCTLQAHSRCEWNQARQTGVALELPAERWSFASQHQGALHMHQLLRDRWDLKLGITFQRPEKRQNKIHSSGSQSDGQGCRGEQKK